MTYDELALQLERSLGSRQSTLVPSQFKFTVGEFVIALAMDRKLQLGLEGLLLQYRNELDQHGRDQ